jgi:hypothetical protein
VIVGIGRVLKIDDPVEYSYAKGAPPDAMRCTLWERNLHHSIRPEIKDGFLLPYHDLLELAEKDQTIDVGSLVLRAPDEHWDAFSMGGEHVTHDQAITVLLTCASLLERLEKLVPGNWQIARTWIDAQLNGIWRLRGAYTGLGSALTAFGLTHGTLVAHAVGQQLDGDGSQGIRDPWPLVDKVLHNPKLLSPDLATTRSARARLSCGTPLRPSGAHCCSCSPALTLRPIRQRAGSYVRSALGRQFPFLTEKSLATLTSASRGIGSASTRSRR